MRVVDVDGLRLVTATVQDAEVVFRLMQLYYFESSAWSGEEILASGLYDSTLLDVQLRLRDEPEWTRLLWLDGVLCGFVQVDNVDIEGRRLPELADLFILPKHRGKGIATAVVKAPPSPRNATTCVPGRRNAAATAIGIPEPIAPTTDDRNTWPWRNPI